MKSPARILAAVATAALCILPIAACSNDAEPAPVTHSGNDDEIHIPANSPKLSHLSVVTVGTRTEKVVASLPAQVVMDEDHTVRVSAPISGRIRTLDVRTGDAVRAGAALSHIASSDLALARSELQKAEAASAQTSGALARANDLFQHRIIALKDMEQARNDHAQAHAELTRARMRLSLLGASASNPDQDYVLRAPIAGEIIERNANAGAEVRSDAGTPLFTISDLNTLWLIATVYQRDLPNVRVGERLIFVTDAAPGREFPAVVRYVSSALDPQTHTATVRAVLPNRMRLLHPQTYGAARLLAFDTEHVLTVPASALNTYGASTVVFVERSPGVFVRRVVSVGDDDGQTASIISGLQNGERVVTRGSILLGSEAESSR